MKKDTLLMKYSNLREVKQLINENLLKPFNDTDLHSTIS